MFVIEGIEKVREIIDKKTEKESLIIKKRKYQTTN